MIVGMIAFVAAVITVLVFIGGIARDLGKRYGEWRYE